MTFLKTKIILFKSPEALYEPHNPQLTQAMKITSPAQNYPNAAMHPPSYEQDVHKKIKNK